MVWRFLLQMVVEYFLFIVFDLWTKKALKVAKNETERRHIWASESQIFLFLSIAECLWLKMFPLTWLIITCCGYMRSYGLAPGDLPDLIVKWSKFLVQNIGNLTWNGIIFIWFSFSIMIGNAVDNVFNKIFSGNTHRQASVENAIKSVGSSLNYILNTAVNFVKLMLENVHRSYTYWSEVFTHGNWDYSSQQYFSPPPLPDLKLNKPTYSHDSDITQNGMGKTNLCSPFNDKFCAASSDRNIQATTETFKNGESRVLNILLFVKYKSSAFVRCILSFVQGIFQKLWSCNSVFTTVAPLENLCFMNTVMCCLTKEPGLVANLYDCLSDVVLNGLVLSSQERQFLQTFRELLQSSDGFDPSVLQQFQECCSIMAPALVAKSSRNQQQQDAAEFCLWLLNHLHQCLNRNRESSFFISRGLTQRLPLIFDNVDLSSSAGNKKQNWQERGVSLFQPNESLLKNLLQISTLEWNSYERKNMSPISSCFTGQTIEIHQCAMCNQMSTHIQIFTILPVAVPVTQASVSLNDILQDFLGVEEIEVEEQCACMVPHSRIGSPLVKSSFRVATSPLHSSLHITPMSSSLQGARTSTPLSAQTSSLSNLSVSLPGHNAILSPINFRQNEIYHPVATNFSPLHRTPKKKLLKRTFISKAPKYLVIQLLRFNYDSKKGVMKNRNSIDIPLFNFPVPSFKKSENCWGLQQTTGAIGKQEYELFAIIVHLGAESASFGHYIAYVRCSSEGEWKKCDGTLSKVVDMNAEMEKSCIKENAYLLFYQQTKLSL